MAIHRLLTAEEFYKIPSSPRAELVRGRVSDMEPVGRIHGRLATRIATALENFVAPAELGEVYVESGFITEREPDSVRGPDVSFARADRVAALEGRAWYEGAPDVAIEIRSPSNRTRQLHRKADEYLAAGGTLVWIADPEARSVHVFERGREVRILGMNDELDGGTILPGFTLPLSSIFRP